MTQFKDQYRIESTRLPWWDYSRGGWYFITICTKDKECYFGEVLDQKMLLSPLGQIVADEWRNTETIRPYAHLDEWIIMPNHIHAIIILDPPNEQSATNIKTVVETPRWGVSSAEGVSDGHDVSKQHDVSHGNITQHGKQKTPHGKQKTPHRGVSTRGGLKSNSLGAIIGQFKSVCTKRIHADGMTRFAWQSRFYEHIIRDERSLGNIRQYIVDNPAKWDMDEENPKNVKCRGPGPR